MLEHKTVRVWTPTWWNRADDEPTIPCGPHAYHYADVWFLDCEHTPTVWDYVESARDLCAESGPRGARGDDSEILEVISSVYFTLWSLHRRQGAEHVNQWPLALVVLAGLREAGYNVVKTDGVHPL